MANYLITGSSGFVGRHLCTQLQGRDINLKTISRCATGLPGIEHHWQGDLRLEKPPLELLRSADVIIHLAGLAHQSITHKNDRQPYFDLNRDATLALAKAADLVGVKKFLFVSSVKAALYDREQEPNDEAVTALPDAAYGLSKRQAEDGLLALETTRMQAIIVRPSLVYGAGVKGNLHSMMLAIRNGWFPSISGGGARSMISVYDLCAVLIRLAATDGAPIGPYIATDGQRYTIERIGSAIRAAMGKQGRGLRLRCHDLRRVAELNDAIRRRVGIALPLNKGLVDKLCGSELYSAARLQQAIDWRPSQTLEDQLPAMLQYVELHDE